MEGIFRKGDRVFDYSYGWGTVVGIQEEELNKYIVVKFDSIYSEVKYFVDGVINNANLASDNATLSFKEYTLQGFSQERPRWRAEKLQSYYYINYFYMTIKVTTDNYDILDEELFKNYNYFKTSEEAEEKLEQIKKNY